MIEASDLPVTMEDLCALASHSLSYMLMYRMDMDDYDVFTAEQYEDFRISTMFKIILMNKDARIEDSASEVKRLSAQWDRQFNEMRNVAVCD
jgi:hypothetical protein